MMMYNPAVLQNNILPASRCLFLDILLLLFFFFFFWGGGGGGGGMVRQDYFTHFEASQSLSVAKTGRGRKRNIQETLHPTIRKQNLACLTCDPSQAQTTAVRCSESD